MAEKQFIQGEDIVILVNDKTTLHATTHTLNIDLAMKEVRTKDTDGLEQSPGDISWSVDGDGLVCIDSAIVDASDTSAIIDLMLAKTLVTVIMKCKVEGGFKSRTGKAYFTKASVTAAAGENSTYSYSLTGSGNLTDYVDPEP